MSKTHALPLTRVGMRLLLLAPLKQAVVQRCGRRLPPVHSLITLGGQHQGVANTPGCSVDLTGAAAKACTAMQLLLARGAYAPWVRENIVQAQYFKVRAAAVIKQLCARHVKYVPGIQRNSRKHMVQAQYFKVRALSAAAAAVAWLRVYASASAKAGDSSTTFVRG